MRSANTCANCAVLKCEVRAICPDDETANEPRQEVLTAFQQKLDLPEDLP